MGFTDKMKIQDVIMWDDESASSNDIVVYKHEIEDFNKHSKLIVHQNQYAVFFQNGQSLHVYEPGKYDLDTPSNIPFLSKLINIPTGGVTQFHCEVFFINKIRMTDIGWGTANPIPFRVEVFGRQVRTHLSAMGSFGVHIEDKEGAKRILELLTGTQARYTKTDVRKVLKGKLIEKLNTMLGDYINNKKFDIFNLASYYTEMSDGMKTELTPYFKEFGIDLDLFSFESIEIPEKDLEDIKKIEDDEFALIAEKRKYENLGENYFREKSIETMKIAAANEGMAGTFMSAGMGLGMGAGMGTAFGAGMTNVAQNAFSNGQTNQMQDAQQTNQVQGKVCATCGASLNADAKFCNNCGKPTGNTCIKCGAIIPSGAKFCNNCGASQASVCPHCGKEITPNSKFCNECGKQI